MTLMRNTDTIIASQHLPVEFLRLFSAHQGEEPKVASMLSGLIAARQEDGVIYPQMLRRNLVVPAHEGAATPNVWRVE